VPWSKMVCMRSRYCFMGCVLSEAGEIRGRREIEEK